MDSADMEICEKVREFNRFYTHLMGLLSHKLHGSNHSLAEARTLFHLDRHFPLTASDLSSEFKIDPGYLSRVIGKLEKKGLVKRERSADDSRRHLLTLTGEGKRLLKKLVQSSNRQIKGILAHVSGNDQKKLVGAMAKIRRILTGDEDRKEVITIRGKGPGDIGYVIYRHGVLYAEEYGFDESFDLYVGKPILQFAENFDPDMENLWVAEWEHRIVGTLAMVNAGDATAQLRWLLVEPEARGKGVGKKLVEEGIRFCRRKGYREIFLWTIDYLAAARKIYADAGFRKKEAKTSRVWGQDLTEERWSLRL